MQDLQQHRSDIFDKFISQMKSLIGGAFAQLLETAWAQPNFSSTNVEATPAKSKSDKASSNGGGSPSVVTQASLVKMGGPEPDECIQRLMDETQSLRHVLAGYFPPSTTQRLFTVIGKLLSERVSSVFSRFGDNSDRIVRVRITANVEWILGKLRTVGGCSPAIEEKLGAFLV